MRGPGTGSAHCPSPRPLMRKICPRTHESASSQVASLSPMFFGDQTLSFRFASGDLTESRISVPGDDMQANEENSGRSPEKGYIRYVRDRLYHPSRADDFRGPSKPGRCDRAASGKGGLLRTAPGPLAANHRTRQTGSGATSAVPGRSVLAGLLVEEVFRLVFQVLELVAGLLFEPAGLVLEILELLADLVLEVLELVASLVDGLAGRGGYLLEFLACLVERVARLLSALLDHRTGRRRGACEFRAGTRFLDLLTQALGTRLDGSAGFLQLGSGRLHAGFDLIAVASPGGDRQRQAQRDSQSDLSIHGALLQG